MKTIKYIFIFCILLLTGSCNDFLEEKPTTQIDKSDVYNSPSTALGALSGCYATMASNNGYSYSYYHVLSVTSGLGVSIKANDVNLTGMNIMTTDINIENVYTALYNTIGVANDIISGMKESTITDLKLKNRISGEAALIRGISYFNLVRLFGRVSLITKPVENFEEAQAPRADISAIYEQIITDFEDAYNLLPEPGEQDTGRPHKYAAKALLAKVYLTLAGNEDNSSYWEKAYNEAHEVYLKNCYSLITPYSKAFGSENKNNAESIFEIQFAVLQGGSRLTETTFPLGHPLLPNSAGGNNWGKTRPSKLDFDRFDTNDPRRDVTFSHTSYFNILETNANRQTVILYPTPKGTKKMFYKQGDSEYAVWIKYVDPGYATVSNCNFVYYRYADLLLILAEAANEIGEKNEAAGYLNEVLDRAKDVNGNGMVDVAEVYPLPAEADLLTKESLREIIINERLTELCGETDAWYTIRRRGEDFLKSIVDAHNAKIDEWFLDQELPKFVYKLPASTEDIKRNMLLPFPANEIARNVNISNDDQNYGYK